ncbi:MAG: zinc ribbon domain-containing protein, partial [Candidatus Aenigmatarchaeota archaeon]
TCQSSESCSSCADDCGACKKVTKEEEMQRNTETKTTTQQTTTKNTQKNQEVITLFGKDFLKTPTLIIGGIIILIILVLLFWGLNKKFKFIKIESDGKKEHQKESKKESKIHRCSKCKKKLDEDSKFCPHCGHKNK